MSCFLARRSDVAVDDDVASVCFSARGGFERAPERRASFASATC
jgi:hypothetical protein